MEHITYDWPRHIRVSKYFSSLLKFLNYIFFDTVIGEKAKVEICLKLANKFCEDSETRRGIAEIQSQLASIVWKEDTKINGEFLL